MECGRWGTFGEAVRRFSVTTGVLKGCADRRHRNDPVLVLSGFVLWLNYAASFQSRRFSDALREFAVARFVRRSIRCTRCWCLRHGWSDESQQWQFRKFGASSRAWLRQMMGDTGAARGASNDVRVRNGVMAALVAVPVDV